jgi:hypothetical protein
LTISVVALVESAEFWLGGMRGLTLANVITVRIYAPLQALVSLNYVRRFLLLLSVPEHIVSGLYTVYLVVHLCSSGWVPQEYIWKVATCIVVACVSLHVKLRSLHEKMSQELQTLGTNRSIAMVNEKLAGFNASARQILLLPMLVGLAYILLRRLCLEALLV